MSVLEISKNLHQSTFESIIKMNTMKVTESRKLTEEQGLKGYSQSRKAEFVAFLEQSSSQPVAPPRREGKRRTGTHVKIIPHPKDMDIFERQEMQRQKPLVKSKLNEWYDWLLHHVLKTVESKLSNAFKAFKETIAGLWGKVTGKETLKDIVKEEVEKKHEKDQEEAEKEQWDNIDLTPKENETSLKGVYKSSRSPGLAKRDVDTYIEKVTSYMKTLIEQQIREMRLGKVKLCPWIK